MTLNQQFKAKRKHPPEVWERAKALLAEGKGAYQIAGILNVPASSVYYHMSAERRRDTIDRNMKWRRENRERYRKTAREYAAYLRKTNPEKVRKYSRAHARRHKEERAVYNKIWRAQNPQKIKMYAAVNNEKKRLKRVRMRALVGELRGMVKVKRIVDK